MKKSTYFFKQLTCLFTFLFLVIASVISTCSLHAAITTSFPPPDFREVDHTTPQYTKDGNTQYNPKGIIGYYYKGNNEYQLTDTVAHMTVAIWNKNKIDLNQNWEFDLKLFFDTGNASHNQGHPFGSPGRIIADGIAFVLQNDARPYAIGAEAPSLGYAGIRPSFAIEFDTEYNNWWWEGYGTNAYNANKQTNEHINYLKNGTVSNEGNITPPPYYKPMQNNWATVGVGDWFNVKIVWRKGYANSKAYYDLLTYMQEGPSKNNGPLLLRDSIRFNSLSEVMTGLEVDENCQALVTWGITSATCSWANHQMVQFVKLETTNVPPPPSPTVLLVGNCWLDNGHDFPMDPPYNLDPNNTINPYHPYHDTLLQGADITGCYEAGSQSGANDTIEYKISCTDVHTGLKCNYWLSLSDIPDDADIEYYLNGTLVTDNSFYATNYLGDKLLYLSLKYPYEGANSMANAKIVINGVEYNFKIFVEDSDCSEICDAVTIEKNFNAPTTTGGIPYYPTYDEAMSNLYYAVKINGESGSNITTAFVQELPSRRLILSDSVACLNDTSYKVFVKLKIPYGCADSTTYRVCATLDNGISCCDTFRFFMDKSPFYDIRTFLSSTPGAVGYEILDTNALYGPAVPPLNVQVYDDYGNSYQTLYNSVPVSAEGVVYYGDLPMPLNNIVFRWGDRTVTIRVVKISK